MTEQHTNIKLPITRNYIESLIYNEDYHHFPHTTTVVCCLKLNNGGVVIGSSTCIDRDNFCLELESANAKCRAIDELWKLEEYAIITRS